MMKKIVVLIAFTLTVLGGFAQDQDLDPRFASYMIETERRTVFAQNMVLNQEQGKVFWSIYSDFELELEGLRKQTIQNLKNYSEQYEKMSDEQADVIMKIMLENETKRASVRKKYYKKMVKALGGKTATRFMQLDSIVSMMLKLSIYDELPLVGDHN